MAVTAMTADAVGAASSPGAREAPLALTLDVSAVPRSPAGAGRYIVELARQLAGRPDVELSLLARRDDGERWTDLAGGAPGRRVVLATAPAARPLRLVWEQLRLPGLLRRLRPAVHHGPHYTMPERAPVPVVVTVHDCTFFDHPEWHERSKVLLFRRAIAVAARRAAAIVCVSQATAERLSAHCSVAGRVFVAPHGVDLEHFNPVEAEAGADAAALGRLGLSPGQAYVLFMGTVEPRKNVPSLIGAFGRLAPAHPDLRLVIAGQAGWGEAAVAGALRGLGPLAERVRRTGYVAEGAVPALLRRAAVAVYPSWEEGYGLPALEALACGTPLVTTEGTAMAELAGPAALLVPPGDQAALAEATEAVLGTQGDGAAERRRSDGLAIAARHTWAASADTHLEAYRYASRQASPRR